MSKKKWIIVVASILVVVVIGIGVGLGIWIREKKNEIIELHTWSLIAASPNQILLKYSDERTIFECSVDKGYFVKLYYTTKPMSERAKYLIAKPGETIHWDNYDEVLKKFIDVDLAYAEFRLRLGDKIIGYAVVKITLGDLRDEYNAEILKSEVFKNWLGQYKDVTEEYVTSLIEQVKSEN
ncbi:MAG: hypothetical protein J1F36_00660 [Clostridiales bacterium]|nr:hypothetical protein [Clostridiales bacterium]